MPLEDFCRLFFRLGMPALPFRTFRRCSTIIAFAVATLHPVCAERRAAFSLLLVRYQSECYIKCLTPHMVLAVVSKYANIQTGPWWYSSFRAGVLAQMAWQVVEGVLRHISKTPPATPAARNTTTGHRSRHLSSSSQ
ncbi:hypothetical protein KCP71_19835 [Salmonella enterica subsp. enterica]|nr:hypothetical protein KCP71_19835 [Salmonella enterica subsp. enterica]